MYLKLTLATTVLSVAAFAQAGSTAPGLDTGFQIRYASNLTIGDSVINISNTGRNGANLNGPGFGSTATAGDICVNAYAFSSDEQLVACCSCPVTPNGLVSLSANNDLISNTLTGVRPNSIVIKLLATRAGVTTTGPSCTNSAALAGSAAFPLENGMVAWGTTIHVNPPGSTIAPVPANTLGNYGVTETAFTPATLSSSDSGSGGNFELDSITGRCMAIIGNGSSFGICKSCRAGGLGANTLQ